MCDTQVFTEDLASKDIARNEYIFLLLASLNGRIIR